MSISREQLAKVRTPFRVLSGFIFVLSFLLVPTIIFIAFTEPYDHFIWVITAVILIMGYISGHVSFTGYAPEFLLFTHGAKDDL
jgi:cytochrome c biogenesis protein CcdA